MKTTPAISDIFNESEILLLAEAMGKLRDVKTAALRAVHEAGFSAGSRAFEERDFGVPDIDRLMARLNAE